MKRTADVDAALETSNNLLFDKAYILLQGIAPQRLLSRLAHWLSRLQWNWWRRRVIAWFVRRYGVDPAAGELESQEAYPHFNAFFTRGLRPGARPLAAGAGAVSSPVDGTVYEAGYAEHDRLLQAKGREYTLEALLGADAGLATQFVGGPYITLYLAPRDYHRVHMPLDGRLCMMRAIPGRLFSVNPTTTRALPGLFTRNERLVTLFDTEAGPMAVVLVGAMLVSAIETVWSGGIIQPAPGRLARTWRYPADGTALTLKRGDEMGRFNMGSTVIVLFARGRARWAQDITAQRLVRMGQLLGVLQPPSAG